MYDFELDTILIGIAGTTLETNEGDYMTLPRGIRVEVELANGVIRRVDLDEMVIAYRKENPEVVR